MEELLGFYYVLSDRSRFYADVNELEITQNTKGQIKFALETRMSGQFGSTGSIWEGICIFEKKQLIFKAKKLNKWRNLAVDDEKQEDISKININFKADVLKSEKNIELKIHKDDKVIHISKIKNLNRNEVFSYIYWLTSSISKNYKLNMSMSIHDKVPNWRLSTLLIKEVDQILYEGRDATELIIEYDLYTEREQKKQDDEGELEKEHYRAKAIFDQNKKILKFSLVK